MEYFELARKYVEDRLGADADEQTKDVLAAGRTCWGAWSTTR